jgi:hypothetical protein
MLIALSPLGVNGTDAIARSRVAGIVSAAEGTAEDVYARNTRADAAAPHRGCVERGAGHM